MLSLLVLLGLLTKQIINLYSSLTLTLSILFLLESNAKQILLIIIYYITLYLQVKQNQIN